MFKKENRLTSGVRFSNSKFLSTPQFVLKVKENGFLLNRFGIVVSKKIDKRAVGRNKVKRMFRNILVNLNKNMTGGHDILIIVKIGIANKTKEEMGYLVRQALGKAGLVKMND